MADRASILILGSTGKLGRALARAWPRGRPALWQHRPGRAAPAAPALEWDIAKVSAPLGAADRDRIAGIVMLAGPTGDASDLEMQTVELARAAADLGAALSCRVLLASSQAVYGPGRDPLSEDSPCAPANAYGRAKLAMEQAMAGEDHVTCLRIGNVAGCDALAAGIAGATPDDPVTLDRFADGQGPRRAMIGAADLAALLPVLLEAPELPRVLNVARAGSVGMAEVLAALDVPFAWRPAPRAALPDLQLDVSRLGALWTVPQGDAAAMARQGWPEGTA
ncbi:NAD-dependent epimerase/dehydratase family protein [Salipiger sp. IMCC34102]|uniref:NAD-dependent epimerase/dehydratase family protein n=1 Tax=Salipiger sp. IMCC34102 TaxID=2510647 RepID=UPI00101D057F|nr:NAD-dependent epimerase/dehydratase family protein [Salipiger sp. IMCC34102]RYH01039.1 NAD-dependent epimerase/dehydratase family protein [Salipiger sp. IMCC34102]